VAPANTAEEICQLAFEQLVPPAGVRDDVAMVVIQHAGLAEQLDLRLPADPRMLVQLRRVLRRWLRERGASEQDVTEVTIAVNEACANSIEHAYSPQPAGFSVRGVVSTNGNSEEIVITVIDEGQWRARRGENRGRGLQIMDAAMDGVEVRTTECGTEIEMRRRLQR
jgi:anti-sigma regulatory factor (Ser/Thr protein kinase)